MQVLDLDLSGNGPATTAAADSTVKLDVGRTGNAQQIGWVGAADSLLVIDTVGDGQIDVPVEATFQGVGAARSHQPARLDRARQQCRPDV